jgi:hypothetical protein
MGDTIEHTLLCPNQIRFNGVVVDDVLRHLSQDRKSTHSIYFRNENVNLPLKLKGVISYLETPYPTQEEINNCRWLTATNDSIWDTYSKSFSEQEEAVNAYEGLSNPIINDRQVFTMTSHEPNLFSQCHRY